MFSRSRYRIGLCKVHPKKRIFSRYNFQYIPTISTKYFISFFTSNIFYISYILYLFKKKFVAPFYGWGSTASKLELLRGGSLLFTTKFPEISGTHFTNLRRMKGRVDLGVTQWF